MSLGKARKLNYLSIEAGKITLRGTEDRYDYFEGTLIDVRSMNSRFGKVWTFLFEDETREQYSFLSGHTSPLSLSLMNNLANTDRFGLIRITPYMKDGYTRLIVTNDGHRLNWHTSDIPRNEKRQVGGKIVIDDSKKAALIDSLAERVKAVLTGKGESAGNVVSMHR